MQSSEIVRNALAGLVWTAVVLAFGFGPLWFMENGVWSATIESTVAMPTGESKPAETFRPLELKKPTTGGAEYIKQQFGR